MIIVVLKKEVTLFAVVIVVIIVAVVVGSLVGLREPTSFVMALEGGLEDTSDKGNILIWIFR